jgi:hypothetical protein
LTAGTALFSLSSIGFWPPILGVLGVVGGIYLFSNGFRMLRYKRLILNTPLSKIRSAAIGLVEINGMPVGPHTLSSPITGDPCFYYSVRAWQWNDSGKSAKWQQVLNESLYVPFFIEDSTGRVLVNPQGADLDVHRDFYDEIRASAFQTPGLVPDHVKKFLAWRGLVPYYKIRLEERVVKPGYPLFVFGTLGENDGLVSWAAQRHVSNASNSFGLGLDGPLSVNLTFRGGGAISRGIEAAVQRLPAAQAQQFTFQMSSDRGPVVLPDQVVQNLARTGVTLPAPVVPESAKSQSVEDEKQFDLQTKVAVSKGERNDPFTISSQSQREVVQSLAWKSTASIWGGPILTLICLYFLWIYWEWM